MLVHRSLDCLLTTSHQLKNEYMHNKAPKPDGFLAEFYQVFGSLIKGDLMAMFSEFHRRPPTFQSELWYNHPYSRTARS
jgi:hypothetical protein